ncbi:hypothetical protein K7I13_01140 [Brucepastera parasyntrophica]|uniref:hypothetical protein n=1 Tax=Brucepastera parasyntrophica TaxID=2880008 RepID=UPI00210CA40E|nr:hypothetical protein [Brucepastera parasyntrophica]ULQ59977.1 hypothetical protein K7I13_01140 [Brucepastera parasyntrophica]
MKPWLFMDAFFETVKLQDFRLLAPYYSESFFSSTSEEEFAEKFTTTGIILGPYFQPNWSHGQ